MENRPTTYKDSLGQTYRYADQATRFMDSQQSKLDEQSKEIEKLRAIAKSAEDICARIVRHEKAILEARVKELEAQFKNFHRSLCERFGYVHDDNDWKRDQISLEEYIWAELKHSEAQIEAAKVEGFNEGVEVIAKICEVAEGMPVLPLNAYEMRRMKKVADSKRGGE